MHSALKVLRKLQFLSFPKTCKMFTKMKRVRKAKKTKERRHYFAKKNEARFLLAFWLMDIETGSFNCTHSAMIFVTEKNEIDTWVEVPKFTKLDTIVAKLITLYRMNIELLHTSIAIAKHTVTWRYPCRANRHSFDSIAIKTKRVTNVRDLGSQNKTTTELLGFFFLAGRSNGGAQKERKHLWCTM